MWYCKPTASKTWHYKTNGCKWSGETANLKVLWLTCEFRKWGCYIVKYVIRNGLLQSYCEPIWSKGYVERHKVYKNKSLKNVCYKNTKIFTILYSHMQITNQVRCGCKNLATKIWWMRSHLLWLFIVGIQSGPIHHLERRPFYQHIQYST